MKKLIVSVAVALSILSCGDISDHRSIIIELTNGIRIECPKGIRINEGSAVNCWIKSNHPDIKIEWTMIKAIFIAGVEIPDKPR